MPNKNILPRILTGFLILLILIAPQVSYADWGVGVRISDHQGDRHFYRWHEHPRWGLRTHYLPVGYFSLWVGLHRYYYYDGLYYSYVDGDYVLINPPIGAHVNVIPPDFQAVIINGRTYYTDNGIYYILTAHHGYKVVAAPVYAQAQQVIVTAPVTTIVTTQDSYPINLPNNSGGYTTVVIKKSGNGYLGPQGEFYAQFPSVTQLKVMYAK